MGAVLVAVAWMLLAGAGEAGAALRAKVSVSPPDRLVVGAATEARVTIRNTGRGKLGPGRLTLVLSADRKADARDRVAGRAVKLKALRRGKRAVARVRFTVPSGLPASVYAVACVKVRRATRCGSRAVPVVAPAGPPSPAGAPPAPQPTPAPAPPAPAPTATPAPTAEPSPTPDPDDPILLPPGTPNPQPEDPEQSAFALIDAAVAASQITAEQGLTYKVFAAFGDPRLPAAYQGNGAELPAGPLLRDIAGRLATLPDDLQATLEPFLLPPIYKGSWGEGAAGRGRALAAEDPCTSNQLDGRNYQSVPSANGKVRVWWRNGMPYSAQAGTTASLIAGLINDDIWPKLTGLMGKAPQSDADVDPFCRNGGDGMLDIYLSDLRLGPGTKALTVAYPGACSNTPAFIVIDQAKGITPWGIAHELFHAIQYAYAYGGPCEDFAGVDEGMASWAGDYVYPNDNDEHDFDNWISLVPAFGLTNDYVGYDTWTFAYFLTKQLGPGIVRGIYEQAATSAGPAQAIDAALSAQGGMKKYWPMFAKAAWNQDPVVPSFAAWDGFTAHPVSYGIHPLINGVHERTDHYGKHPAWRAFGKWGPARDYHVEDIDALKDWPGVGFDVRMIKIHQPQAMIDDPDVKIEALLQMRDGTWKVEDWSNRKTITFCRDRPEEDVKKLVLIDSIATLDRGGEYTDYPSDEASDNYVETYDACTPVYEVTYEGEAQTTTKIDPEDEYDEFRFEDAATINWVAKWGYVAIPDDGGASDWSWPWAEHATWSGGGSFSYSKVSPTGVPCADSGDFGDLYGTAEQVTITGGGAAGYEVAAVPSPDVGWWEKPDSCGSLYTPIHFWHPYALTGHAHLTAEQAADMPEELVIPITMRPENQIDPACDGETEPRPCAQTMSFSGQLRFRRTTNAVCAPSDFLAGAFRCKVKPEPRS